MTKTWTLALIAIAILIGAVAYASPENVWGRDGAVCVWGRDCGGATGGGSGGSSVGGGGSSFWDEMRWDGDFWG